MQQHISAIHLIQIGRMIGSDSAAQNPSIELIYNIECHSLIDKSLI
jgi:hypothetical protein